MPSRVDQTVFVNMASLMPATKANGRATSEIEGCRSRIAPA
jgi:hypothetical protein